MDLSLNIVLASVILLVVSTALNIYYFIQYRDVSSRYADLQASQQQLTASTQVMQARLQSYEFDLAVIKDPIIGVYNFPKIFFKSGSD